MTIEEMKARKTELGLTNEMLADASGVPLSTVQKLFSGVTKAPRKRTIDAIEGVLRKDAAYGDFTLPQAGMLAESGATYAVKDTRHTIEDYYALPEERRVELIDGVFYDMEAPAVGHQRILGSLYLLFEACIEEHEADCEVFLSPCDVRLDMDDYTMVQPDLMVICRRISQQAKRIEGAPDLAVEILSPSTRSKDMVLKLYKYQQAGVREYWIIDPKFKTVTVHRFDEEEYNPKTYDFNSEIPIGISDETCKIDFSKILKRIERYEE